MAYSWRRSPIGKCSSHLCTLPYSGQGTDSRGSCVLSSISCLRSSAQRSAMQPLGSPDVLHGSAGCKVVNRCTPPSAEGLVPERTKASGEGSAQRGEINRPCSVASIESRASSSALGHKRSFMRRSASATPPTDRGLRSGRRQLSRAPTAGACRNDFSTSQSHRNPDDSLP